MGCDGGTIPKRNEIVKRKQKDQTRDKNADLSAKWQFCALSGMRLKKPIVACQLGRLYNKDAVIEYLLEGAKPGTQASTSNSRPTLVDHIRSLKDVRELRLKEKPDFDSNRNAKSGNEQFNAQYVCPISGLDVNGKYRFVCIWPCGCVVSERALKEVPNDDKCIVCSRTFDNQIDLIVLNGDEDEITELRSRIDLRKQRLRQAKRDHKHLAASTTKRSSPDNETNLVKKSKRHKSVLSIE